MSQGLRYNSSVLRFLAPQLREDFFLLDIGCSGGIDPGWRDWGDRLTGLGIDPNIEEIERLTKAEQQRIAYLAGFADVPNPPSAAVTRTPWGRLSVARTIEIRARTQQLNNQQKTEANLWQETPLAPKQINVAEAIRGRDVDFLKIDIDGLDYAVLQQLDFTTVSGVAMEVNFIGGVEPWEHTFHNTDRFMRERGFELHFVSTRAYSLAALPAPYALIFPAQSTAGRPLQGDAIYFKDPVGQGLDLGRDKLLKLVGAMALASQHDAAAEILVQLRQKLDGVDVDGTLDCLAQEAVGRSYREHMAAFEADDASLYPPKS